MQRGEGADAVARGVEFGAHLGLANAVRLQVEQARDDLQVVLHAVMNLASQQLLLLDRLAQLGFLAHDRVRRLLEGAGEDAQLPRREHALIDAERAALPPDVHRQGKAAKRVNDGDPDADRSRAQARCDHEPERCEALSEERVRA